MANLVDYKMKAFEKRFKTLFLLIISFHLSLVPVKNIYSQPLKHKLVEQIDVNMPASGEDIEIKRTYDYTLCYYGPFGHNWTHSYNVHLDEKNDGTVLLMEADGRISKFEKLPNGTYNSSLGDHSTLSKSKYNKGGFERRLKNGITYNFNSSGNLKSIVDRNNNVITLYYNNNSMLKQVVDPVGAITDFEYDSNNLISKITDSAQRSTKYQYYSNGCLRSVVNPMGYATTYYYDEKFRLTKIRNSRGFCEYFEYDTTGRLQTWSNEDGINKLTFQYEPKELKTIITDAKGNETILIGHKISEFYGTQKERDNWWPKVRLFYDQTLSNITDSRVCDIINNTEKNLTRLIWDDSLNITQFINASLCTTSFSYDEFGNIVEVIDPLGNIQKMEYENRFALVTKLTDANGNEQHYKYDKNGNLRVMENALGGKRYFVYDSLGNCIKKKNGTANSVRYTYFKNGLVDKIIQSRNKVASFIRDNVGNITKRIDFAGNTNIYQYDELDRLVLVKNALNNTTNYGYDQNNNLVKLIDAKGNTTLFEYDKVDRINKIIYPDNSNEQFIYDHVGNIIEKQTRSQDKIIYCYDSMHRLTEKIFPDSSRVYYEYDTTGNLKSAKNDIIEYEFIYDKADRLLSAKSPLGDLTYKYDSNGNRIKLTGPNNYGKILYKHDALNRLVEISKDDKVLMHYFYNNLSVFPLAKHQGNGAYTNYTWNNGTLQNIQINSSNGTEIYNIEYAYDALGNITKREDGTETNYYSYDNDYQLISSVTADNDTMSYYYDELGNRILVENDNTKTEYETNLMNQYVSINGMKQVYDKNGNLIKDGANEYLYDYENRLVKIETPTHKIYLKYDPFGRLIWQEANETLKNVLYDGFHPIMLKDKNGLKQQFIYGNKIDEPLTIKNENLMAYYHQDALGSVVALSDTNGNVIEKYRYDPYGITDRSSNLGNPFMFNGRDFINECDIYYYRMRFYHPKSGRFMSVDPIGISGGKNLYVYVANNPINRIDPFGLVSYDQGEAIGNFIGAVNDNLDMINQRRQFSDYLRNIKDFSNNYPKGTSGVFYKTPDGTGTVADEIGGIFPEGTEIYPIQSLGPWDDVVEAINSPNGEKEPKDDVPPDPPLDDEENPEEPPEDDDDDMDEPEPSFIQLASNSFAKDYKINNLESTKSEDLICCLNTPPNRSLVRASVPIFGKAGGIQFKSYTLEYGKGEEPKEWFNIVFSQNAVTEGAFFDKSKHEPGRTVLGNLGNWDTGLKNYTYYPDYPADHPIDLNGVYTVRLVVEGKNGKSLEERATVEVGRVISNAFGGLAISEDKQVKLRVPEHALMDDFSLISIKTVEDTLVGLHKKERFFSSIYQIREPGEKFTVPAQLEFLIPSNMSNINGLKLAIFTYNKEIKNWVELASNIQIDRGVVSTSLNHIMMPYGLYVLAESEINAYSGETCH